MSKYTVLAGVTLLLTLTCIGLQAYHAEPRCAKGVECGKVVKEQCQKLVPAIRISGNVACDWRTATSVVGLIMLTLTLIFVALVVLKQRGKDFAKHIKIVGIVIIPLILATIGLMIADIVKGKKYMEDSNAKYNQGSYIANLILTFFITILVAYTTLTGAGDKQGSFGSPRVSNTNNA